MTERVYFGCKVDTWRIDADWHPYPWRFRVTGLDGITRRYSGIPNQCETEHSALMRGWWRAKWLANGTYGDRYRPSN